MTPPKPRQSRVGVDGAPAVTDLKTVLDRLETVRG